MFGNPRIEPWTSSLTEIREVHIGLDAIPNRGFRGRGWPLAAGDAGAALGRGHRHAPLLFHRSAALSSYFLLPRCPRVTVLPSSPPVRNAASLKFRVCAALLRKSRQRIVSTGFFPRYCGWRIVSRQRGTAVGEKFRLDGENLWAVRGECRFG